MTAPVLLERLEDEQWHRLSRRMLLIHPITELIRALPALVGVFLAGHSNGHDWFGLIAAAQAQKAADFILNTGHALDEEGA